MSSSSSLRYQHVAFPSKGPDPVTLRGLLVAPAQRAPAAFCVLVHPWGFLGGSRANMLPYAECLASTHGFECLVFNNRGVCDSGGSATVRCSSEVLDVVGACDWVSANRSPHMVLIGSSAGAAIAGSALDQVPAAKGLVAIAYTFGWCSSWVLGGHYHAVLTSPKPKCFIMGTADGFTSVSQLEARVHSMQHAALRLISHADHFSLECSHCAAVCEHIADFVKQICAATQESGT